MSAPEQPATPTAPPTEHSGVRTSPLLRGALWVAIGALIAAALVSVVWVLIGPQNGIIGRAFLTILLLAAFAGVAILDTNLAPRRPAWFVLVSMTSWVLALLVGAFLIWMPERRGDGESLGRFLSFLLAVLVLQLAVLHVRLFAKSIAKSRMLFSRIVGWITIGLVAVLALMLVLPLTFQEWLTFHEIYWRIVVATTILAAVGTALVPLMNALFGPRTPRAPTLLPWPTYADGVTPLPALADGQPDWNAYYTGHPTPAGAPQVTAAEPQSPAPSPYDGYPPAPPLPPR
jgi:hypothetical protein